MTLWTSKTINVQGKRQENKIKRNTDFKLQCYRGFLVEKKIKVLNISKFS